MKVRVDTINRIAGILEERDGMDTEVARQIVKSALRSAIVAMSLGDFERPEEIWMEETGLEVDFLMELVAGIVM